VAACARIRRAATAAHVDLASCGGGALRGLPFFIFLFFYRGGHVPTSVDLDLRKCRSGDGLFACLKNHFGRLRKL